LQYQTDCTDTGLRLPENRRKPFFLKELSKLWNKVKPDLPWEEGQYGPSNTLMIDDSPYKALCNPVSSNLTLENTVYVLNIVIIFCICSDGLIF
jgi:hypothetical protein